MFDDRLKIALLEPTDIFDLNVTFASPIDVSASEPFDGLVRVDVAFTEADTRVTVLGRGDLDADGVPTGDTVFESLAVTDLDGASVREVWTGLGLDSAGWQPIADVFADPEATVIDKLIAVDQAVVQAKPIDLLGSSGDDVYGGSVFDDRFVGRAGDDVLLTGAGADTLLGGRGADVLTAGEGDDRLFGGSGGDVLDGEAGEDIVAGGRGDDVLTGGADADVFAFGRRGGTDTVTDFEDGLDRLLVRGTSSIEDLAVSEDDLGNAVVSARGLTVTLLGVAAADVAADDFLF